MRPLEILEGALSSGDGPSAIGAQVARRAGIAASEVRGTYEGLWLLDRADEHASAAPRPEEQLAKTASIRAEMHLDAGDTARAEAEAKRAISLDPEGSISRQATRTLADVYASQGRFAEAAQAVSDAMPARISRDERWIDLSARTVLARIALEQGRIAEAVAGRPRGGAGGPRARRGPGRAAGRDAAARHRPDVAGPATSCATRCRGPYACPSSRRTGATCSSRARPSRRPGSPPTSWRSPTPRAWVATVSRRGCCSDGRSSASATSTRPRRRTSRPSTSCHTMRLPLRAADVLDGLAGVARARDLPEARLLAAAAFALRTPRMAVRWGYSADYDVVPAHRAPAEWIDGAELSDDAVALVTAVFTRPGPARRRSSTP